MDATARVGALVREDSGEEVIVDLSQALPCKDVVGLLRGGDNLLEQARNAIAATRSWMNSEVAVIPRGGGILV